MTEHCEREANCVVERCGSPEPLPGRPTLVVAQADLGRLPTLAAGALKLLEDLGHGRPATLFAIVESLSCPKSVQSHWSWARAASPSMWSWTPTVVPAHIP